MFARSRGSRVTPDLAVHSILTTVLLICGVGWCRGNKWGRRPSVLAASPHGAPLKRANFGDTPAGVYPWLRVYPLNVHHDTHPVALQRYRRTT